jgi:branched-chain amino acid transport system substrate-binding protein
MKKLIVGGVALTALAAFVSAANAQTIKIGVAGPITGPNAAFGAQLKNGAEAAAAAINAKGGINGMKIEIVLGDDVSKPDQGVAVANKMVADGVKFVVGHFNSSVSIPASTVYNKAGVIAITPASTNPQLTERKMWNVFRTCGRDDQQGAVAGAYLAKNYKGKKVAIVHDKTTYGKGLADETKKSANKAGIKEALYEGVNVGEKDFSALVSKIKAAKIDIVYFGGLHTEAGLIIRQMRDQGLTIPMFSGDGIVSAEFVSIAGPGAEGTLMTFNPDPRKNPNAQEAVKQFRDNKFEPEAYTLYSYAALQIIAEAAARAKSVDPKKVADEMLKGKAFKTVIGDIAYNKKGDITRPDYIMYSWKKGKDGKIDYTGNEL